MLKLYDTDNTEVKAQKVHKTPRFNAHRGRTWQWGKILIDGQECDKTFDNSWGEYWYFKYKGEWYKVNIFEQYEPGYRDKFTTHIS